MHNATNDIQSGLCQLGLGWHHTFHQNKSYLLRRISLHRNGTSPINVGLGTNKYYLSSIQVQWYSSEWLWVKNNELFSNASIFQHTSDLHLKLIHGYIWSQMVECSHCLVEVSLPSGGIIAYSLCRSRLILGLITCHVVIYVYIYICSCLLCQTKSF